MSELDLIELLDPTTLKRLDLPKTATSPQGLNEILMERSITLTYQTNNPQAAHVENTRSAAAIGTTAILFTAPTSARRIIYSWRMQYATSAVVGTRNISVAKVGKDFTRIIQQYVSKTVVASTTEIYCISGEVGVTGTNVITQNYPTVLEPEWSLFFDDTSNIDGAGDTLLWEIDYVEITTT